jgi:hypothetical protein
LRKRTRLRNARVALAPSHDFLTDDAPARSLHSSSIDEAAKSPCRPTTNQGADHDEDQADPEADRCEGAQDPHRHQGGPERPPLLIARKPTTIAFTDQPRTKELTMMKTKLTQKPTVAKVLKILTGIKAGPSGRRC